MSILGDVNDAFFAWRSARVEAGAMPENLDTTHTSAAFVAGIAFAREHTPTVIGDGITDEDLEIAIEAYYGFRGGVTLCQGAMRRALCALARSKK